MARTYTISGSLVTVNGDPFDELKDDFLEFDLVDDNCDPIADASVVSITATLRSLDGGSIINGRNAQDVLGVNGGTLTSGTFRLELSGDADLVSVGRKEMQRRELTLIVTHSTDKVLPVVCRFPLRAFADVG
jgi:hypothetical protein